MLRLVRRQTLSAISDMAFAFCSVPPNSDMQMGGSKLTNMEVGGSGLYAQNFRVVPGRRRIPNPEARGS